MASATRRGRPASRRPRDRHGELDDRQHGDRRDEQQGRDGEHPPGALPHRDRARRGERGQPGLLPTIAATMVPTCSQSPGGPARRSPPPRSPPARSAPPSPSIRLHSTASPARPGSSHAGEPIRPPTQPPTAANAALTAQAPSRCCLTQADRPNRTEARPSRRPEPASDPSTSTTPQVWSATPGHVGSHGERLTGQHRRGGHQQHRPPTRSRRQAPQPAQPVRRPHRRQAARSPR